MKRESKVIIILLVIILVVQFRTMKRIDQVEVSISNLSLFHMRTNDILTGRICRLLDHFDLPTEIVKDNPDGTTSIID